MKYEVTVAEAAAAPVPGVETSPLPKEAAESQRTTICPTEQLDSVNNIAGITNNSQTASFYIGQILSQYLQA